MSFFFPPTCDTCLGMVQSTEQYKFIYQIAADLVIMREQFCHPAARTILRTRFFLYLRR